MHVRNAKNGTIQCLNISAEEYQVFQKFDNIIWFCKHCNGSMDSFPIMSKLSEQQEQTDNKRDGLASKMDQILLKLDEKCSKSAVLQISFAC